MDIGSDMHMLVSECCILALVLLFLFVGLVGAGWSYDNGIVLLYIGWQLDFTCASSI